MAEGAGLRRTHGLRRAREICRLMGRIARGRDLSDADTRGVGKPKSIHRCAGDVAVVEIVGVL